MKQKVDQLTLHPLRAGWNLHHLDMKDEDYEDLSDESHFTCLNRQSHETVHFLWRYYQKDRSIINRLVYILEKMSELNSNKREDNEECIQES